ncbi:hypothetical protein BDW02DRAFT_489872, partial [Decorospora gaudefroyi]
MASTTSLGSYEQYKLDTKRFILWLVVTARAFGHKIRDPAAVLQDAAKQQPSGRLNGKARKAAPPIAALSASKIKYDITTDKTLELAEYVRGQDMVATMPKFVWHSYKRAIKTRERYAARYAKEELTDKKGNDGHAYFLWVLKRCHEIFEKNLKVQ